MKIINDWTTIEYEPSIPGHPLMEKEKTLPPLNEWVICELESILYHNSTPYNVLKRTTYCFEPGWRWFGGITGKPVKWKKI